MEPNLEASCSICLRIDNESKSLYEKVKHEGDNAKYLPKVIEEISGVKLTIENQPQAVICEICTAAVLQAEVIIRKCRKSSNWQSEMEIHLKGNKAISVFELKEEFILLNGAEKDEGKNVDSVEKIQVEIKYGSINGETKPAEVKSIRSNCTFARQKNKRASAKKCKAGIILKMKSKVQAESIINQNSFVSRKSSCENRKFQEKTKAKKPESKSQLESKINDAHGKMMTSSNATDPDSGSKRENYDLSNLPKHRKYVRTVNRNKSYFFRCTMCSYTTHFASYFRKHMQLTHEIAQPRIFKCDQCVKDFLEYRYLQQHITYEHQLQPQTRKYLCAACGRAFIKFSNLQSHQRIHLSKQERTVKPKVSCEYCDKAYSQHSILMHVRTMHAVARPHCCTICRTAFAVPKSLQAHMRTCHPAITEVLLCPCCEVKFRVRSAYEAHVRRGGCQKLGFNCDYCAWGFRTRERLEKHKLQVHKKLLHLEVSSASTSCT